jgi:hypothetical protein
MLEKVSSSEVFLREVRFLLSESSQHYSICIYVVMLLLLYGHAGNAWQPPSEVEIAIIGKKNTSISGTEC